VLIVSACKCELIYVMESFFYNHKKFVVSRSPQTVIEREGNQMTGGEQFFLIALIGSVVGFGALLAWASHRTGPDFPKK